MDQDHSHQSRALKAWESLLRSHRFKCHPAPPTAPDIAAFVQSCSVPPPASWLEWLHVVNGADCNDALLWVRAFFGITNRPDRWPDVRSPMAWSAAWRSRGWIPIADDGCGDYFLLGPPFPGGRPDAVMFWDQACDLDAFGYVVSSNLWTFLMAVLERLNDTMNWPFDFEVLRTIDPGMSQIPAESWPRDPQV